MSAGSKSRLARLGLAGTAVVVALVVAALNLDSLPLVANNNVVHVEFAEAAGLEPGNDVMVSGAQVGEVRSVDLEGQHVVADIVISDDDVRIGDRTEARIITTTLLGRAAVELEPLGSGDQDDGQTIPLDRTSSPYNLTSTLNQLSAESAAIDKEQLATALKEAAGAFTESSPQFRPAFEGLTELAGALAANDDELQSLLEHAARVTDVVAGRDQQIASLLGAGRSLLGELRARRDVVISLLRNISALSEQLRATMRKTDDVIGPSLDELDRLVRLLNRNKDDLQDSITGLQGYAMAFGEAVGTGPWFDAYVQNLTAPTSLLPGLSGGM